MSQPLWTSRVSRLTIAGYDGSTPIEKILGTDFWQGVSNAPALRAAYSSVSKGQTGVSVVAGDLIVVGYTTTGTDDKNATCADNAGGGGNTYNQCGSGAFWTTAAVVISVFYAIAKATETLSVTITHALGNYPIIFVHVVSGADQTLSSVLDGYRFDAAEASTSTTHTSASITTTNANDYLFVLWSQDYGGPCTLTENGSGFTKQKEKTSGDPMGASFDRVVSSMDTYSDTITSSQAEYLGNVIVAFQGASPSLNDAFTGSGGATASGAATGTLALVGRVSGGALAGGNATETMALGFVGVGGALASGIAASFLALTVLASGGSQADGSATVSLDLVPAISGGAVAGGSADWSASAQRNDSFTGVGGSQSSGAAIFNVALVASPTGGTQGSGAATVTKTLVTNPSGGSAVSGSAIFSVALVPQVSGGAAAGGTAVYSMSLAPSTAGGAQAGGIATFSKALSSAPSGGALGGGTATWSVSSSRNDVFTGSGGSSSGGLASFSISLVARPTSGAICGGSSVFNISLVGHPVGGAVAGGAADFTSPIHAVFTGSGGAVAGGVMYVWMGRWAPVPIGGGSTRPAFGQMFPRLGGG